MRKIKSLFIICAFLFGAQISYSYIAVPYFNITLHKASVGGDEVFSFRIRANTNGNPIAYLDEQLDIQTEGGVGSDTYYSISGVNDGYYITEGVINGWATETVICTSDNSNVVFTPISRGIYIKSQPYSSVDCVFTNIKTNSKTPVLIVPGILGTNLSSDGDKLWLDLNRNFTDLGDEFMDSLSLKINFTQFDSQVDVGLMVGKEMANVGTGKVILFDYTEGLIKEFESQGYSEGNSATSTIFTFPYDWRYGASGVFADGKTNIDALKQKIEDVRALTGSDEVDVVAHSTGGLLLKKYVMENSSDNHIGKAVLVGVPHLGAPKAVKVLIHGDNFGIPFLDELEMKKISANFPVAYELTPSEKYITNNGSYVRITTDKGPIIPQVKIDLDFNQTKNYMVGDHGLNAQAIANAQNLHTDSFDNFDIRSSGIDLYSIVGCRSGTLSKIKELRNSVNGNVVYLPEEGTGDGTVPMASANYVPVNSDHSFFAIKSDHGKMLSSEGIRQQIVNLVSGSTLTIGDGVITKNDLDGDPNQCELNGHWFGLFSPVSIEVTDQMGRRVGVSEDGNVQSEIPGADYHVLGEHKFVFVPTDSGQVYSVNLKGTGNGTFTFKDQIVDNGVLGETHTFVNIPVTTNGSGQVNVGTRTVATTLLFDSSGDGQAEIISPSATVDAIQSQDIIAPISNSTISGIGTGSFYGGDVLITLSATDPISIGHEGLTSGVLETKYMLDDGDWVLCSTLSVTPCTVSVLANGLHSLKFFSADGVGNNEIENMVYFSIDKTPPVISVISPIVKDYLRSEIMTINATSTDVMSGVSKSIYQLDGKLITTGENIDLFYEKLGSHLFTASSTDMAGNTFATTTKFRIIATLVSTISDVERAYDLGWIAKRDLKNEIIKKLKLATRIEKRVEYLEEKLPGKSKLMRKIEKFEEKFDKTLLRLIVQDLEKKHPKYINDQAYRILVEDLNWMINN